MDTLRSEIEKTVHFFADIDLKSKGKISKSTKEIAQVQRVSLDNVDQDRYKVVKVFRVSARRKVLARNLSKEEAKRMVNSYPDSSRSMVVFMKQ